MTRLIEPSAEQLAAYQAWLETRPPEIRAVAERFDPWTLYRLKTTGQIVGLSGISEPDPPEYPNITVSITVLRGHNLHCRVFGLDPDDLETYEAEPSEREALLRSAMSNNPALRPTAAPAPPADTAPPATD